MASQKKESAVPAATLTTRPAIVVVNGRPLTGEQLFQIVLKTTSSDPEVEDTFTDHQFKGDDFTEILQLNVVDLVQAGGYGGALGDIKVLDLLENLALGILFDRGEEDPLDWSAGI